VASCARIACPVPSRSRGSPASACPSSVSVALARTSSIAATTGSSGLPGCELARSQLEGRPELERARAVSRAAPGQRPAVTLSRRAAGDPSTERGPDGDPQCLLGAPRGLGKKQFVAVDGGMPDNMEVALYGQRFEATLASRVGGGPA